MSNTFCAALWKHVTVGNNGDFRICCYDKIRSGLNVIDDTIEDYENSRYLADLRNKVLAGEEIPNCATCYEVEKLGQQSQRIHFNLTMEMDDNGIEYIELRLGNHCNLKCIGCSPSNSISIANDYQRLNWFESPRLGIEASPLTLSRKNDWSINDANIEKLLPALQKAKRIVLVGGEPFLVPHLSTLLDKLDKHKTLVVFTNLTIWNRSLLDQLGQFDKVEVYLSIDSWGQYNDIARYPSRWDIVWNNFNEFVDYFRHAPNFKYKVFSVIHNISIFGYKELAQRIAAMGIEHQTVILTSPNYSRLELLPQETKDMLLKKFTDNQLITNALQSTAQFDTAYELETLRTLLHSRGITLPPELEFIKDA